MTQGDIKEKNYKSKSIIKKDPLAKKPIKQKIM